MQQSQPTDNRKDPLLVPTREEWDKMSPRERHDVESAIIDALEREFNLMGETTRHFDSRAISTEVLRRYFSTQGRQVFVASDLHTLYPGERAFYPDLLVVFDVPDHHRRSWNVLVEGKGLDFVLEILSKETRSKDRIEKLNLYARLQIPEYFLFDPESLRLSGYRLKNDIYTEIKPSKGGIRSNLLNLMLLVDGDRLRFAVQEGVDIPFADELMTRLNEKLKSKDQMIQEYLLELEAETIRAENEAQRAEEATQRAEEERKRAEAAEAEILRLQILLNAKNGQ